MYREFFGLQLKPFSITPDPRFLYMSPGHKEALAHLLYGLKEASGFVVITGEVGTGKTTILNAFLLKLPPRMPKVVIKNPHIKPENLYFLLGEAIGLPEEKRSRDHIAAYEDRLKEMGGAVLIVDESQGLSVDMLEEIRLLSNLETVNEKLVQIMLLGQQELNEKLKSQDLRQLKQRIGIKYHIPPLDSGETRDYIDHRLRVAGYEPKEKPLFTVSAMSEIFRHSKGYPRLINILCDNVLIAAFTDNVKQISAPLVRRVASELENSYSVKKGFKTPRTFQDGKTLVKRIWKPAAAVLLLLVLAAGGVSWYLSSGGTAGSNTMTDSSGKDQDLLPSSGEPTSVQALPPDSGEGGALANAPASGQAPVSRAITENVGMPGDKTPPEPAIPPTIREEGPARKGAVLTIREGDTVAKLAADYYGRVDPQILKTIKAANPEISSIDRVHRGQKIFLPKLKAQSQQVLYSVSVASYHSIDEAKAVFSELIGSGYQAVIYPYLDEGQKNWYRVTLGTFSSRQEAIEYARQLQNKGFPYAKPVKISMEE